MAVASPYSIHCYRSTLRLRLVWRIFSLSRRVVLSSIAGSSSLSYVSPSDEDGEAIYFGLSASTWLKITIILCLFACLFWPNLRRLWQKTNPINGEANWGHAICIPIIGLYYLYVHREELMRKGAQPFVWGPFLRQGRLLVSAAMIAAGAAAFTITTLRPTILDHFVLQIAFNGAMAAGILGVLVLALDWSIAITIFGIGIYIYGIYPGQNDYVKDMGMIVTLFGVVLLLCGWDVMRVAWFPIVFLICGIPWPGLVYSWVAGPLQQLAANTAVEVLKLTGVNASSSGTKIIMFGNGLTPPRTLNVAEACAGMRSLMTFITVGAAVAFLSSRALWQKLIITVSAIPIAIFCNVMRVSGQGLLDHYVSQKLSESFAHQFVGMIMLIPAFFMILLVGVLLDKIFIEEADDGSGGPVAPPLVPAAAQAPVVPRMVTTPAPVAPPPKLSAIAPAVVKVAPPAAIPAAPKKPVANNPVTPAPVAKMAPPAAPPDPKKPAMPTAGKVTAIPATPRPANPAGPQRPAGATPPRPATMPPRPGIIRPPTAQKPPVIPPTPKPPNNPPKKAGQ